LYIFVAARAPLPLRVDSSFLWIRRSLYPNPVVESGHPHNPQFVKPHMGFDSGVDTSSINV